MTQTSRIDSTKTKNSHITRFKSFALPLIVHDVIRAIGLHGSLQGQDPNPADFKCYGQQRIQSMRNVYKNGAGTQSLLRLYQKEISTRNTYLLQEGPAATFQTDEK